MKSIIFLLSLLLSAAAWSDERILSFHSDIRVFADGQIEVTETIEVRAEGNQIRRGIYRDFPVEYRDRLGNDYKVTFRPLGVQRNDRPEDFHTVRNRHDVRTYFGSADRLLDHGVHKYTFRYRVTRMLGFFDEHDELYWNVTGNRWAFSIDRATATVRLEFDVPRDRIMVDGYTGRLGSTAQDYGRFMDEAGNLHFAANGALPAAHGLTIVAGWPKGFVVEPGPLKRLQWLLADNRSLLIALLGWVILLAYYIPVWRKHGKDPDEGIVVTRYDPPRNFSPASLRYIRQMYYDDKVMTAALVNLAVKGYVSIEQSGSKHSVSKVKAETLRPELAPGEAELLEGLFSDGDSIELKQSNHKVLQAARQKHARSLKKDYKQSYFRTNALLNIPGVAIVGLTMPFALGSGNGPTLFVIAAIALMFVTLIFFASIMRRPTLRGRQLLDEMLGFKDFLEIAEKDEMNLRNPPNKTPELFEAYLPFALALGVEQQWSERFADVLAAIRQPDGSAYSPSWYSGSWNSSRLSKTTSSFSRSLGSAVSSSTTAPGSSSGGGGGGSSGGGGGGGGGGGW